MASGGDVAREGLADLLVPPPRGCGFARDLSAPLRAELGCPQRASLGPAQLPALDPPRVSLGLRVRLSLVVDHVHGELRALVHVAGHLAFLHPVSVGGCLGNVNAVRIQTETLPVCGKLSAPLPAQVRSGLAFGAVLFTHSGKRLAKTRIHRSSRPVDPG